MLAAGADLGAAPQRIPCRISPLDFGILAQTVSPGLFIGFDNSNWLREDKCRDGVMAFRGAL
jgi:hypothetical protein